MNPTLFKTRGPLDPVNDSDICAPRPELDQVLRAAYAPTVDAYLAILGSRQTGKTTLLYQIRHKLRARGYGIALLDLGLIRDQPEAAMYHFIASQLLSELEAYLPRKTDKREAPALPSNPIEFRRFLFDTARLARAPRIIVLIDEVEAVSTEYSDSFFGTIRNIFSSRRKEDEIAFEKYLIVLCGSKELHRLTSGPNSPLNIAERVYLHDLEMDGVQFLVNNFKRIGITAPPQTAQWIFDQTNGHPYLTQKLCSFIEQKRPTTITNEHIQNGAREFLMGDDHLEKLITQIDSDETLSQQLRSVVAGQSTTFSRIKPAIARLELLGAIREVENHCQVRNAIYHSAFRTRFDIPEIKPKTGIKSVPVVRIAILVIALAVFILNLPLLIVYMNEIWFHQHAVNQEFYSPDLAARAIIRYESIVRPNDPKPNIITVEIDNFVITRPITVTAYHVDLDISIEGNQWFQFDPPAHREKYSFMLHQIPLVYNPFQPTIPRRHIDILFDTGDKSKPTPVYQATFWVDAYSSVILSLTVSFGSIIAFLTGLWGNIQKAREIIERIKKGIRAAISNK